MLLSRSARRSTSCILATLLLTFAALSQPSSLWAEGDTEAAPTETLPTNVQPEQQLIQQRLEQLYYGVQGNGQEPTLYSTAYLLDLYRKNNFALLWTNQENITQLLSAIINAAEEGFIPDDYHLKTISRYFFDPEEMISPAQRVQNDLLLSDAFILLGQHKRYGKVDPSQVDEKHNLESTAPRISPVEGSLNALQTGTVRAFLDQLSPHHQAYVALKEALSTYKGIAGKGGWPQIPAGPSLRPGMQDKRVPLIQERLIISGDYIEIPDASSTHYTPPLVAAVESFQKRHHLGVDGVIGARTLAAMNVTVEQRIKQIRVNLERTRWIIHDLPSSNLIVDIAGFMLQYYHNNQQVWTSKVMVGKPYHQTPIFRSAITYLVLNPTWTIPPDIIKNETINSIIKDPEFLAKDNLRVLDYEGNQIDPATIDWQGYKGRYLPYLIRQTPGSYNALGRIKFMFPNPYHVYLHDTPSKSLFGRTRRAFSHGCIRVQNPLDLGRLILTNDTGNPTTPERMDRILATGKTATIMLKQPLPIYLMYLTSNVSEGKVTFKADLYNRDDSILKALNSPPLRLKLTTQIPEAKKQPQNPPDLSSPVQLVQSKQPKSDTSNAQDTL